MTTDTNSPPPLATPVVLRLHPGEDLRLALEALARRDGQSAILVSGIGSLSVAMLRYAGADAATCLPGPLELLSLAGTLSPDGAHLHALVADGLGLVRGGHACAGCIVATTAELTLLPLGGVRLGRAMDPVTGYAELVVGREDQPHESDASNVP